MFGARNSESDARSRTFGAKSAEWGLVVLSRPARAEDLFDLALDLLQVHELAVDGREPDVGHLIQVAQAIHHHLADLPARDLDAAGAPELGLDVVDDRA